jgi:hypothetical protein
MVAKEHTTLVLFHVSEDPNIKEFVPRSSKYTTHPVVWAEVSAAVFGLSLFTACNVEWTAMWRWVLACGCCVLARGL